MKFIRKPFYKTEKSQQLFESLRSARQKYPNISNFWFEKFLQADKSKTYKYIEKMCELFIQGYNGLSIISKMTEYQKYEVYLDDKDITHKTYDDILEDIRIGEIRKLNSVRERRNRIKNSGLIYDKNNIRIYCIDSYEDAVEKGKSTLWCTSLDREKYNFWTIQYNMYIIFDLNRNLNSNLRKVCYLNSGIEDTFVTSDNIHYYESNPEYKQLKEYYGPEIMKLMV